LDKGPTATGTIKVLVVGLEGVCGCESASKKTLVVSPGVSCAPDIDDAPIAFTVSACVLDAAHRKRLTPASKPNVVCFIRTLPESPGPSGEQLSGRCVPNPKVFLSFVHAT
jgi:hypothetical protein